MGRSNVGTNLRYLDHGVKIEAVKETYTAKWLI